MRLLSVFAAAPLLAASWLSLFDGKTLTGWVNEGGANFRVENGVITVDQGPYTWLRSEKTYKDYELEVEFNTAADGNSGIFLRSAATGRPHETGYELQIFDAHKDYPTGGVLGHGKAPANTKLKPNVWNKYQIRHQGKRMLVKLNGKQVLDLTDDKATSGYIGLQFNPNKPISFRNIRIREL
jgi:hypothetical protein